MTPPVDNKHGFKWLLRTIVPQDNHYWALVWTAQRFYSLLQCFEYTLLLIIRQIIGKNIFEKLQKVWSSLLTMCTLQQGFKCLNFNLDLRRTQCEGACLVSGRGAAVEGRLIGVWKFYYWGKCTTALMTTQIGCLLLCPTRRYWDPFSYISRCKKISLLSICLC